MSETTIYVKAQDITASYVVSTLRLYRLTLEDDKSASSLLSFILRINQDVRLHTLFTPGNAEDLWLEIRESEVLTDFVLKLKTYLLLRLDEMELKDLIDHLIRAISVEGMSGGNLQLSLIDEVLKDRLPNEDFIRDLLYTNVWIVPLYILSIMPLAEALE